MINPVAIGLAGQTEQKEWTEFRERRENKPRHAQTERDVSSGTHHVINPSRLSPAFVPKATKAGRGGLGTRLHLTRATVLQDETYCTLVMTNLCLLFVVVGVVEHSKLNSWVHCYLVMTSTTVTDVHHLYVWVWMRTLLHTQTAALSNPWRAIKAVWHVTATLYVYISQGWGRMYIAR